MSYLFEKNGHEPPKPSNDVFPRFESVSTSGTGSTIRVGFYETIAQGTNCPIANLHFR